MTARRTQEERSAATRRLLLDATVECLVEHGYAGTTTTRVSELAGVSRGAQVHHFATKDELVVAAVRHLAEQQAQMVLTRPDILAGSADPVGDALELLWKAHQGPTFDAAIELWVAARTDPELREATTAFERALTARFVEVSQILFGTRVTALPDFQSRLLTALEAMRGLRMVSFLHPHPSARMDERWQRSKTLLRPLFEAAPHRDI
ncbi:TetR/AcrR family transcriptional regulator [Catenulispora subtropica]|uniref:TetR/AcrR family transcriptional regulator n=1 Tax=Catenulispora subtropica TaxID=450798 RepID=A0ABP5EMV8_9ACTN